MYAPSKISKKIHATAIHLVIISVALLQFLMVVFTLIRSGDIEHGIFSLHTKVALGLFVLTLNICSAQLWYRTCKKISPIKYDDILLAESSDNTLPEYIPEVLKLKNFARGQKVTSNLNVESDPSLNSGLPAGQVTFILLR